MNKTYFVESEMCDRVGFQSESDRNELALALYEEHIYFLTMRVINWYGNDGTFSDIEEDASFNVRTWDEYESFDFPTQVAFWDVEGNHYCSGIAWREQIICACCGDVVEIAEVYEFTPENVRPIIVYEDWEAFDDFIIADNERHFKREEGEEDKCV